MKIKKIGAICNAGGVYYLMNQRDYAGEVRYQWLGDGRSAYPLVGLPLMDLENICAMFDITEKKRDKLLMRMMDAAEAVNWDDTDPAERRLKDPKLCVRYDGRDLLPLETSVGVTFIQEKYLAPLDSLEYMQLYERRGTDGGLYIVAKIGMIIQAIIMPMDLPDEAFMGLLGKLTHQCRAAFNRRKRNAECGTAMPDPEQSTMFKVDSGTGEVVGEGAGE